MFDMFQSLNKVVENIDDLNTIAILIIASSMFLILL